MAIIMHKTAQIALIGTGRMGKIHLRVLHRLGVLAGISDINKEDLEKISKNFDGIPYFTDYKEMISTIKPDGVIIATPTSLHYSIAKDILENFSLKGLLIEKPVCNTLAEALDLLEVIKKSKTKITVGHIEVYNPVVTKMLELFNQGVIGDLRTLIFQRRGAVSDGRLDSIGDVFGDIGIHDFDIASRLLHGSLQLKAISLKHVSSNVINSSTVTIYNKDIICTFHFSREYAGKKRQIELEGTKGTMVVDLLDQFLTIRQLGIAKGDTKSITIPYGSGETVKVYGEPILEEIWSFIDTMNQMDVKPLVSIHEGIKGLELIEYARKSSETGSSITIQF
jgi:predicted dehydrogenase